MLNRMLAVDPSLTSTGWALFEGGRLKDCGYIPAPGPRMAPMLHRTRCAAISCYNQIAGPIVDEVLVEVPQFYTREKSKGDPNNLAPLWGIAGAFGAVFHTATPTDYRPREWKATVAPDIMMARIWRAMTAQEVGTFCEGTKWSLDKGNPKKKDKAGDALDAVGIGLFHLGRIGVGGTRRNT